MKYKANGGYQILNFEGVDIASITSLDFKKIKDAILREKTFQIIGLSPQTDVKANANCEVSYDSDNDVCIIKVLDNTIVISNDNSVVVSPIEYGTNVEANPQLVGDEPNLSSIQIGDDKYKVSQVSASDSLIYDEETDKLKIDGTIYKVGGGQPLYVHNLFFNLVRIFNTNYSDMQLTASFISPISTPATDIATLYDALNGNYRSYVSGNIIPLTNPITIFITDNNVNYMRVLRSIGVVNRTDTSIWCYYSNYKLDSNNAIDFASYTNGFTIVSGNVITITNNWHDSVYELKPMS